MSRSSMLYPSSGESSGTKIAIGVGISIIVFLSVYFLYKSLSSKNSENYAKPRNSKKCNSCYNPNNPNVCNCLRVNNCNLPPQCKQDICLNYESENASGNRTCTRPGINTFVNAMNNEIFTCNKSSLCDNINPQNVKSNCFKQCQQSTGPFRGLPPCSDCCNKACSSLDCSKNIKYRNNNCAVGGRNRGSSPKGPTEPCNVCKDVCNMGPEYCQRCKDDNDCP